METKETTGEMEIMDADEAAKWLSVSPWTIKTPAWRKAVGLKSVKIGNLRRYRLRDLRELVERRKARVE